MIRALAVIVLAPLALCIGVYGCTLVHVGTVAVVVGTTPTPHAAYEKVLPNDKFQSH